MAVPPRGETYDGPYWDPSPGKPRLTSIREHFANLAYPVEVGPWPMNELGPLGSGEFENAPGSTIPKGKLGGLDDKPNNVVMRFQIDYNIVSKAKMFVSGMGTLSEDGLVGPYTLNALRYVTEKIGGKHWPDVVKEAKNKGHAVPVKAGASPNTPKQAVFAPPSGMPGGNTTGGGGASGGGGEPGGSSGAGAGATKKSSAMPLVAGAAILLLLMTKK